MTRSPRAIARFIPSLVALVVLAGFIALRLAGAWSVYDGLLTLWGIVPFEVPFLDIDGPLSSMECARLGYDVIAFNPCDLLYRPYNYSPLLLTLDWLPVGGKDRVWLGLTVDIAFLLSLSVLPPPGSWRETVCRCVAAVSTMVVFAVERANVDVIIFPLVVAMLFLLCRKLPYRVLGLAIGFLAGAIKYYPFILLGLIVKERLRTAVAFGVGLLLAGGLFFRVYADLIERTLQLIPFNTAFIDMFGAKNVLYGSFELFRERFPVPAQAAEYAVTTVALMVLTVFALLVWIWRHSTIRTALFRMEELSLLALMAGSIVLVVCFFFPGQNVGYRGIFLLLLLPGLGALGRDRAAGVAARVARLSVATIPILMWSEAIRLWLHLVATGNYPPPAFTLMHVLVEPIDLAAWGMREIVWWLLIGFLTLLLLGFAVEVAVRRWRDVRALFRREIFD